MIYKYLNNWNDRFYFLLTNKRIYQIACQQVSNLPFNVRDDDENLMGLPSKTATAIRFDDVSIPGIHPALLLKFAHEYDKLKLVKINIITYETDRRSVIQIRVFNHELERWIGVRNKAKGFDGKLAVPHEVRLLLL